MQNICSSKLHVSFVKRNKLSWQALCQWAKLRGIRARGWPLIISPTPSSRHCMSQCLVVFSFWLPSVCLLRQFQAKPCTIWHNLAIVCDSRQDELGFCQSSIYISGRTCRKYCIFRKVVHCILRRQRNLVYLDICVCSQIILQSKHMTSLLHNGF